MNTRSPRILCIGKDAGLLRSRCAVLQHAGYNALDVMVQDAAALLQQERFDLIILSAILTDAEKLDMHALAADATPILALKKLVFASELIREVERNLPQFRQSA